jgi:hypothetical protein
MIVGLIASRQNIIWGIQSSKVKIPINCRSKNRNYFIANVCAIVNDDVYERDFGNVPGSNMW